MARTGNQESRDGYAEIGPEPGVSHSMGLLHSTASDKNKMGVIREEKV